MKVKHLLEVTAVAILWTGAARGATWEERWVYVREPDTDVFPANQFTLDLFGTYANRDRFGRDVDHGGGGVGVDYFFNKYIGLGADTYVEEWRLPYRVNGDVILRLPIEGRFTGVAPYVLGGGGREFKWAPQWTGNVGGGVEFRFNPYTALFGDYRRIFADKTDDYNLVRGGLRIGF